MIILASATRRTIFGVGFRKIRQRDRLPLITSGWRGSRQKGMKSPIRRATVNTLKWQHSLDPMMDVEFYN
jgi:hypothetical protein